MQLLDLAISPNKLENRKSKDTWFNIFFFFFANIRFAMVGSMARNSAIAEVKLKNIYITVKKQSPGCVL